MLDVEEFAELVGVVAYALSCLFQFGAAGGCFGPIGLRLVWFFGLPVCQVRMPLGEKGSHACVEYLEGNALDRRTAVRSPVARGCHVFEFLPHGLKQLMQRSHRFAEAS